ncbi:MAG: transcription-repair coupling factor [Treponema sp.]
MTLSQLENKIANWQELHSLIKNLKTDSYPYKILGLNSGLKGFFLKEYIKNIESNILFVVPTEKDIDAIIADISILDINYYILPAWGTIAYSPISSNSQIFANRIDMLCKLASVSSSKKIDKHTIFITTQKALLTPIPPISYVNTLKYKVMKSKEYDVSEITKLLSSWGYIRVPRVSMRGEFSQKGEVLDIYPMAISQKENLAYRIVFDFDVIEKIRSFDVTSQATLKEFNELELCATKEVIWSDERIETLEKNLTTYHEFTEYSKVLIEELKTKRFFQGEEIFFPLSFEKTNTILSYLIENETFTVFYVDYERQETASPIFQREYLALYKSTKQENDTFDSYNNLIKEYPEPNRILLDFEKVITSYKKTILLKSLTDKLTLEEDENTCETKVEDSSIEENPVVPNTDKFLDKSWFKLTVSPERNFFGNIVYFKEELAALIKEGWHIYIFAETDNQALRIGEILKDFQVGIFPFNVSSGFSIPSLKILVIHEKEIFGRRRRVPKVTKNVKSEVIDSFVELNPGDYVVHVNYGIGIFKGIERVKILDTERDYINLQYANDENTFIPIEQADLVQRYIGNEGSAPSLDVLGSKSWENRKNKVKKSVEDIAEKLIELYSKRKIGKGFAFQKDDEWQLAFEAAFPYEETKDQLTCVEEVKKDMEKALPMDRLICGDVGFGKTEVAMRAAFKAVMGGKQVVFLAPTTILVEQHYGTLLKRFNKFPVRIAKMSRFVSKQEQKKVLSMLKEGQVDIVVGTHRVIQKDVIFKDLGLIIIDEEQRFGVKDKERLKSLKTNVDCLSMSATPIPRTLHMSLLKIRDMSIITTPPQNRKPVETIVDEYNEETICRIIRRETERGGQVFYLHNKIETLEEVQYKLQQLLPELMIETAHGQMTSNEIEDIFKRFSLGGFQVLISTTIIENGIDIPNANTIIIDRADMYGVSQLYQLRGRVGRSDRKAFAALLYPGQKVLSEVAMKRLQAISDFTELGAGFKIAMKDMEIRGAGNLLGREQSGYIYSVGFDLYLRLLSEAIERLKNSNYIAPLDVSIELEYSGFIPDSYISLPETKMEIYKKIASVKTKRDFDSVVYEINDRFGTPPVEVESLLSLSEIKIICNKLFIKSLKERGAKVKIEFNKVSEISIEKLLSLIKSSHGRAKLDSKEPNVLILETGNIGLKEKSEFIHENLTKLL